ncbi:MAG: nucleoside-diphosphate sugar epimerase/dehydratase [Paracoccaceae bacterium]
MTRSQKRNILLGADVLLAPLALVVTFALLYNSPMPMTIIERAWPIFPALAGAALLASVALGIHRIKLNAYEFSAILKTAVFAALLALVYAVLASVSKSPVPEAAIILYGLIFFLMSVASRYAMLHALLWLLRRGHTSSRVLIYGAGSTGTQLAAALKTHDTIVPVAFLDDNPALHSMTVAGLSVHSPSKLRGIMQSRKVKRVLLAMPSVSQPKQQQIARRLQQMGLEVMAVPSFAQLAGEQTLVDKLTRVQPGSFLGRAELDEELPGGSLHYAGKAILVSGAGGSIGSELCRQILACRPRRLVLFEISELALYTIEKELSALNDYGTTEIVPVLGSVTDSRIVRSVMAQHGIEIVLHAAAYKHVPLVEANPLAGLVNNVLGTRTLADAAHDARVESFLLISTDKAVRPTNVMGASKRLAEIVVQDLARRSDGTVFSMVRFGNVLGSSGSVIPLFKEQIARGGPVTVTHDDVTRFFMTISEAARLVLLAGAFGRGNGPRGGDVFVLDMGKPVKIRELASQMIEAAGYSVRDRDNPDGDIEIEITGLRPGEKMHEELLIGEGLLTTPHPKILRAEERSLSELEVANILNNLRSAAASGDEEGAREVLRRWVEGYEPKSRREMK